MTDPNKQRRTPSTTMSPARKKSDPERMVEQPAAPDAPARAAPAEAEAPVEMASGVVARGRCVHIVVPGRKKVIGSVALPTQDPTGPKTFKEVTTSETRMAGPGSTITLPKQELEALRASKFVLPADAPASRPRRRCSTRHRNDMYGSDPRRRQHNTRRRAHRRSARYHQADSAGRAQ